MIFEHFRYTINSGYPIINKNRLDVSDGRKGSSHLQAFTQYELSDDSSSDDVCAEKCVSNFRSKSRERGQCEATTGTKDKMTEVISLQKSNGMFDVSREHWAGSVLETYLGSYIDVKSNCPSGIKMHLWITALSMKILEVKMEDKKDLWDLVMQKSKKFLNAEVNKVNEKYENLMNQAEKFVKTK